MRKRRTERTNYGCVRVHSIVRLSGERASEHESEREGERARERERGRERMTHGSSQTCSLSLGVTVFVNACTHELTMGRAMSRTHTYHEPLL